MNKENKGFYLDQIIKMVKECEEFQVEGGSEYARQQMMLSTYRMIRELLDLQDYAEKYAEQLEASERLPEYFPSGDLSFIEEVFS